MDAKWAKQGHVVTVPSFVFPASPPTAKKSNTQPQNTNASHRVHSLLMAPMILYVKMKLLTKPTVPMAVNRPRIMIDM